jgi:hypothetical protein
MTKYECEYCFEYPLKAYVEDQLGGIFCNEHCHSQMYYEHKWDIVKRVNPPKEKELGK